MSMEFDYMILRNRRIRTILWSVFPLVTFLSLVIMGGLDEFNVWGLCFLVGLIGLIVTFFLASRFYSWTICLFICVFIGLFFKSHHWPLSNFIVGFSTLLLLGISVTSTRRIIKTFSKNSFLKWFASLTGMIIILFMTGFLIMTMHWPGKQIFIFTGCLFFFFVVLAMVFMLPGSNFVSWSVIERQVFFRIVMVPMLFILGLFTLVFVFNDVYNAIMHNVTDTAPWSLFKITLHDLEGIQSAPGNISI